MDRFWMVCAYVTYDTDDGYGGTVAVPSFVLDSWIQGFTDKAGAEDVARRIVDPLGLASDVHMGVEPIGNEMGSASFGKHEYACTCTLKSRDGDCPRHGDTTAYHMMPGHK